MADDERQPFADELKDDAHFDPAAFKSTAMELQDDAHFAPASFQSQAPPAQGGGGGLPFWMQGHEAPVDPAKVAGVGVDNEGPKDMGAGAIPGGGDYTSDDVRKAVEGSTAANDVLQKKKQDDMGGRIKDLQSTMEDMRKNKPPVLERNKPPPKADFSQSSMAYMQVAALMGALAGGFSRRGTTTALKAFTGMMQGLHDGNVESFKQMHEEWKEAEQNVNDVNQAKLELDKYNAVWKDQKTNIDQKMEMMKLVATKYDDQITYNTAKMHDFTKLAEFQQKERDHHEERLEKSAKMMKDMELLDGKIRAQQEQEAANYDDAAERFVMGDKNARAQAIGRGGASAAALWNTAVQKAMQKLNVGNNDILANQQSYSAQQVELNTVARRGGNVAIGIAAFDEAAKLAMDANAKSKRSGVAGWNAVLGQYYVQSGDPSYRDLVNKTNTAINIYARIIGGGGAPHVADQEQGHQLLNPNMPSRAYQAALNALKQEATIESRAPGKVKQEIRDRTTGAQPQPQPQPDSGGWKVIQ